MNLTEETCCQCNAGGRFPFWGHRITTSYANAAGFSGSRIHRMLSPGFMPAVEMSGGEG